MQISQSDLVSVRRARWRVADVRPFDQCRLLTLVGAEPGNVGVERRMLFPFDDVQAVERRRPPLRISIRLWRRACRALLFTETGPDRLESAVESQIDLLPYQLEPALAVLRGDGNRILLADEVGLGKTVQAGLVI